MTDSKHIAYFVPKETVAVPREVQDGYQRVVQGFKVAREVGMISFAQQEAGVIQHRHKVGRRFWFWHPCHGSSINEKPRLR